MGKEDLSKIHINFDTVLYCERTGKILAHHFLYNSYVEEHLPVDFNDAQQISRLNGWRRQILGRNFPPTRKTREFWLQSEKDAVLELIRQHLLARGFVKWRKLTNEYNRYYANVIQRKGEKLMTKFGKTDRLEQDRQAPWRTSGSLIGMANKWKEVKVLQKNSDDRTTQKALAGEGSDEHLTSEDEVEILDPNPEAPAEARKRKPQGKKGDDSSTTSATANRKTTSTTRKASKVKKSAVKTSKAKMTHKSKSKSLLVGDSDEEGEPEEESEQTKTETDSDDEEDSMPLAKRPCYRDDKDDEEGVGYL